MASLPVSCAHCGTARIELIIKGVATLDHVLFAVFGQCLLCAGPISATVAPQHSMERMTPISSIDGNILLHDYRLLDFWPKPPQSSVPSHLPDNLRSFFLQAEESLQLANFDAAGSMFHKVLDVALKQLDPLGTGDLHRRIAALRPESGITPSMQAWARELNELGSDAADDDAPITEAAARHLASFTQLFLMYGFTLPAMLAERRAQAAMAAPPAPTEHDMAADRLLSRQS